MNNKSTLRLIVTVISIVATLTAALTAFLVIREKRRKDELELEEYLDNSIQ